MTKDGKPLYDGIWMMFCIFTICYLLFILYFNYVENILVVLGGGNFGKYNFNSESRYSDMELLHRKICERDFFINCTTFKAGE